jgi:two-component system, NtrC family, response regulator AtoC
MATTVVDNPSLAMDKRLPPREVIFGRSAQMRMVEQKVETIASANVPVLIQGESGTGKEILARLIHMLSPWRSGPFVKVNCPAIPGTLLESELFGYERGAFTGAYGSKPGRVEMAHRGTLFLDEIGELDPALQAKLLQLLQDGQFCRIGAQEDKKVEVRVVCATNRQLAREVEAGNFRQDLYYRINVLNMQLPPLRERRGDIPGLSHYLLELSNDHYNCSAEPLSRSIVQLMQSYQWPGNIRELENIIKRYVILGSEEIISNDLMGAPSRKPSNGNGHGHGLEFELPADGNLSLKKIRQQAIQEIERKVILKALQMHHWNRKQAARSLKISYRALLYKIRQADLPSRDSLRRDEAWSS